MKSFKRYLFNKIIAELPPTRAFPLKRALWRWMDVSVGIDCKINSGAMVWGMGALSVGDSCWLGMDLAIFVPAGSRVSIGSNVHMGPEVMLECGSHDIGSSDLRAGNGQAEDIVVGAGSWIGCRATILGGAHVGPGSVVAAGSVVLPGQYPENSVLAGVPARPVKSLDNLENPS